MSASPSPQSASSAATKKHLENARYAVSLGAAFALLCAVVFDTPETQAAGGIFELLFGGGGSSYNIQPSPNYGYGYGAEGGRHYGQRRHGHHGSRTRYAHYRRHRGNAVTADSRIAERRATERHHIAASTRRALDARLANVTREGRDTAADAGRTIAQGARPQTERRSGMVETVAFSDAATTANPGAVNRRAVCVRACDGYYFPIAAKGSDTVAQQSCDRLCPGAETQVFMMPRGSTKIDDAVAVNGGETYSAFVARLNPDEAKSKSCGCPQTAGNLNDTAAFLSDLTLRPGDTVVTPEGVRVVRRGSRYPFKSSDFLSLAETRDVPRSTRGALYAIERALKTPYGRLAVASNSERRHHRRDL